MKRLYSLLIIVAILCAAVSGCGNIIDLSEELSDHETESAVTLETDAQVETTESSLEVSPETYETQPVLLESVDWDIEDPEIMLSQMRYSDEFAEWREIFGFVPAYNQSNADQLMESLIKCMRYYNFLDYFPQYNTESDDLSEDDVCWYLENVFNVSTPALGHAVDARRALSSEVDADGYFHYTHTGDPGVGLEVRIDDVEWSGYNWIIRVHISSEEDNDQSGTFSTIVMRRKELNGENVWTMNSKADEPYCKYEGNELKYRKYSWNTYQNEVNIKNDIIQITIPLDLMYSYTEVMDGGEISEFDISIGRLTDSEVELIVRNDDTVMSSDAAEAACMEYLEKIDSGRDHKVEVLEETSMGDRDYMHIRDDISGRGCDYYVSWYRSEAGQNRVIIWKLNDSSLSNKLSLNDPDFERVISEIVWDKDGYAMSNDEKLVMSHRDLERGSDLKALLEQDDSFITFVKRWVFYSADYSPDDAQTMLQYIVDIGSPMRDVEEMFPNLPENDKTPWSYLLEDDVHWFATNMFHISESEYEKFKEDQSNKWSTSGHRWGFHDDRYEFPKAGAQGLKTFYPAGIEYVQEEGQKLNIRFFCRDNTAGESGKLFPWGTIDEDTPADQIIYMDIVAEPVYINGESYWTLHSVKTNRE